MEGSLSAGAVLRERRGILRLGPSADVKIGDADVAPIPTRRVTRCVVPIIALFSIAILASVLIKVGGDVSGVLRVHTSSGTVNGLYDSVADVWMGVPYARAPKRWSPPVPTEWQTTLDATKPGPVCPQSAYMGTDLTGLASSETDCLVLNIHAPHGAAKAAADGSQGVKARPVVVLLHGGHFMAGGAAQRGLNASLLARRADAVVVVAQYRLGALGFLAHRALTAADGTSGNYGLLDQQAALRWVFTNAAAFGGDVNDVTLWGQGAGGASALQHVAMADSTEFFRRILLQSAAWTRIPTLQQGEAAGDEAAAAMGCPAASGPDALACLRAKPAAAVVSAAASSALAGRWGPVLDGVTIRAQLSSVLADPFYVRGAVPGGVLAGMGANDSSADLSFLLSNATSAASAGGAPPLSAPATAGPVTSLSPDEFNAQVALRFQGAADTAAIAAFYRGLYRLPASGSAKSVTAFQALAQAVSDGSGLCPLARMLSRVNASGVPTYLFQLDHPLSYVDPRLGSAGPEAAALALGQPCFLSCGHFQGSFLRGEETLSGRIMGSIGAFARGLAPSAGGGPYGETVGRWPRYGGPGGGQGLARLNVPVSAPGSVSDSPAACSNLWDAQGWPSV